MSCPCGGGFVDVLIACDIKEQVLSEIEKDSVDLSALKPSVSLLTASRIAPLQ